MSNPSHNTNNNLNGNSETNNQPQYPNNYPDNYPNNYPNNSQTNYPSNGQDNYPSNYPNNNIPSNYPNNYPDNSNNNDNNHQSGDQGTKKGKDTNKTGKEDIPNNNQPDNIPTKKDNPDDNQVSPRPNNETKKHTNNEPKSSKDEMIENFTQLLREKIDSFKVLSINLRNYTKRREKENNLCVYEKCIGFTSDIAKSGIHRYFSHTSGKDKKEKSSENSLTKTTSSVDSYLKKFSNDQQIKLKQLKQFFLSHSYDEVPSGINDSTLRAYLADQIKSYMMTEKLTLARFHGFSINDEFGHFCPIVLTERPVNGPLLSFFERVHQNNNNSNNKNKRSSEEFIERSDSFNIEDIKSVSDEQKFEMISGVTFATAYIHDNGFIHSNLNPSTVYIDENMRACVCDYSFIPSYSVTKGETENGYEIYRFKFERKPSTTDFNNFLYVSPEIENCEYFDSKSDIYSLGFIIFFILNEREATKDEEGRIIYPTGFSEKWRDLIERCTSKEASKRPSAVSILRELLEGEHSNFYINTISSEKFSEEKGKPANTNLYLSIIRNNMHFLEQEDESEVEAQEFDIFSQMIPNFIDISDDTRMIIHAAEKGDVECIEKVGDFFYLGEEGIHQDEEWALKCYEKAAELGSVRSMKLAAELNFEGVGNTATPTNALKFAKKALDKMESTDADRPKIQELKAKIDDILKSFTIRIPTTQKLSVQSLTSKIGRIKFTATPIESEGDSNRMKLTFNSPLDAKKGRLEIGKKLSSVKIEETAKPKPAELHRFVALSSNLERVDLKNFYPGPGRTEFEKLGGGNFARTYRVFKVGTDEEFAAKVFYRSIDKSRVNNLKREIIMASKFNHATIVKFYGFNECSLINHYKGTPESPDSLQPTIIMKLVQSGNLESRFDPFTQNRLDDTSRLVIIIGVSRGILEMYKHHIIHRDLKPDNILLNESNEPLICDLGSSRQYSDDGMNKMSTQVGTPIYSAPEMIATDISHIYRYEVDVYSFGIIMYQVLKNVQACNVYKNATTTFQVLKLKLENEIPDLSGLHEIFVNLIRDCWNTTIDVRPDPPTIWDTLVEAVQSGIQLLPNANLDRVNEYIDRIK